MQIIEIVQQIQILCEEYFNYVKSNGNECAYTDSIVEKIIERANELKEKYDEEV